MRITCYATAAVLTLLSSAPLAAENWVLVADQGGRKVYLDRDSIANDYDFRVFNMKLLKEDGSFTVMAGVLSCGASTLGYRHIGMYTSSGELLGEKDIDSSYPDLVTPGSVGSQLMDQVCPPYRRR